MHRRTVTGTFRTRRQVSSLRALMPSCVVSRTLIDSRRGSTEMKLRPSSGLVEESKVRGFLSAVSTQCTRPFGISACPSAKHGALRRQMHDSVMCSTEELTSAFVTPSRRGIKPVRRSREGLMDGPSLGALCCQRCSGRAAARPRGIIVALEHLPPSKWRASGPVCTGPVPV